MIGRLILALALLVAPAASETPKIVHVSAGTIVDLGVLTSHCADPRRVVVWLPSGYSPTGRKYAVLYMHDGQNLFDKAAAGYGMEWQIDETLDRLIQEHKVRPTIVVGIYNTPKRLQEYLPSGAFASLGPSYRKEIAGLYGGQPLSDGYLEFIVRELKPLIDRRFNVKTDRANTAIMGSSMGALISLDAISRYPRVFGEAGMMSTHWPLYIKAADQPLTDAEFRAVSGAFRQYLTAQLPDPRTHKLYFDHGSETLDASYARYQERVDAILASRGYRANTSLLSLSFPGQKHNEISWASRVAVPLQFLLPAQASRN